MCEFNTVPSLEKRRKEHASPYLSWSNCDAPECNGAQHQKSWDGVQEGRVSEGTKGLPRPHPDLQTRRKLTATHPGRSYCTANHPQTLPKCCLSGNLIHAE